MVLSSPGFDAHPTFPGEPLLESAPPLPRPPDPRGKDVLQDWSLKRQAKAPRSPWMEEEEEEEEENVSTGSDQEVSESSDSDLSQEEDPELFWFLQQDIGEEMEEEGLEEGTRDSNEEFEEMIELYGTPPKFTLYFC